MFRLLQFFARAVVRSPLSTGRRRAEMAVSVKALSFCLNPQIGSHKQMTHFGIRGSCSQTLWLSVPDRNVTLEFSRRDGSRILTEAGLLSPETGASSSSSKDFTVISNIHENGHIKLAVDVSGPKTQAIFDDVFSKLVAAAQPIPGFRRVKGGKTLDIPKNILLQILGPSKVYKQSIKKIINTVVAEYVEKESLKVAKDLKVEQSFEELEAIFEPGKEFSFNAVLRISQTEKQIVTNTV